MTALEFLKANPQHPNESQLEWLRRLSTNTGYTFFYLRKVNHAYNRKQKTGPVVKAPGDSLLRDQVRRKMLKRSVSISDLADELNVPPKKIREQVEKLKADKFNVVEHGDDVGIDTMIQEGSREQLNPDMWKGDIIRMGFTSDNHLCNHNSREDVLNLLYDIFAGEGISLVYNAGNWIDGEHHFNKNEIFVHGCSKQIRYCAENYPRREGIITKFVAGDDHEGWYAQREGINIGEYLEMIARQIGREDLIYMGYGEADVILSNPDDEFQSWMRVVHPGGGTAYALSYTMQKLVESYQGGEKPNVILAGHYHKLDYTFPREVHAIQTGTTCDQTLFMRKKKIQAMVGGGILELRRAPDGTINRCKVEFITAYDKKFYLGKDRYFK